MKKILLIVGMILCVAVIGSVFAVAVFSANDATATITAEPYITLGWDGTAEASFVLEPGVKQIYTVNLTVDKSTNGGTATFSVVCEDDTTNSKDLENVTITVCSDALGTTAVTGANVTTNDNDTSISGLSANATYYIAIVLDAGADADDIADCGGTMTLSFRADAQ